MKNKNNWFQILWIIISVHYWFHSEYLAEENDNRMIQQKKIQETGVLKDVFFLKVWAINKIKKSIPTLPIKLWKRIGKKKNWTSYYIAKAYPVLNFLN